MDTKFANGKLSSIEEELKVLRSQLAESGKNRGKKFSSLEGIWKNKVNFSFEEAKYLHEPSPGAMPDCQ